MIVSGNMLKEEAREQAKADADNVRTFKSKLAEKKRKEKKRRKVAAAGD